MNTGVRSTTYAALRARRANRQAEQHAVGVGHFHRPLGRAAVLGREPHVAANELNVLARFAELPHGIVAKAPAEAAQDRRLADAAGDRHQHDVIAIELPRTDLGKELIIFAVELDRALLSSSRL